MSLKSQVFHGLKWSIMAKGITQLLSWISTFLVIRWLTPEDYGVMAIAMVFFTLISYFTTNGLTSVLIKEPGINLLLERQIFTFSLALNVALSGAIVISAPWMASYYNAESLIHVMWLMAAVNPVTSFTVVPVARLQKDMRFKEKSIVESLAALVSVMIAFTMAYMGYGYWALVISTAGMLISRTLFFAFFIRDWPGITLNFNNVKPALSYAWQMQFGTLLWFIYNKIDTVILGKLLGMEKLGIYNVGNDIASIPLSKGSAILNDVGFSAFSKVQNDLPLARHYASRSIFILSLVMFPVFYGIAAVSAPLVNVILGDKWAEAAPIITILCLVFPFRMHSSVLSNFANAMSDARFNLQNVIFVCAILILSILAGAQYGLTGAAWGWVAGYSISYTLILLRFKKRYAFTVAQLIPFGPIWLVSALMLASILTLEQLSLIPSQLLSLVVQIALGAVIIIPFIAIKHLPEIKSILKH